MPPSFAAIGPGLDRGRAEVGPIHWPHFLRAVWPLSHYLGLRGGILIGGCGPRGKIKSVPQVTDKWTIRSQLAFPVANVHCQSLSFTLISVSALSLVQATKPLILRSSLGHQT